MRRYRNAKIIATLGPASSTAATIEALCLAGADVFRFNFSHGSHEDHRERYDIVRAIEQKLDRPIAILMDLQGPKLRVGKFADGKVLLKAGNKLRLDMDETPGTEARAPLLHPEVYSALTAGTELLLDDGKIRLRVESHGPDFAETAVLTGGMLSDRKGLNVPDVVLPISALTDKDRRDLQFGLDLGVDWVALSFVQRPEDVAEARKLIAGRAAVISKLEKPSAIDKLTEIIELSDAVMVARGDLGVESPPENVPILQKRIVQACRHVGKPVVVATQMLESMVQNPAPTRAEASDVATAIYDGADAVMLSAESAAGAYPIEAVSMMDKIIQRVEKDDTYRMIMEASREAPENTAADAISAAARQVALTLRAAAVVTFTSSGSTTLRAARERPLVPIVCLTADRRVARRLVLAWGTHNTVTTELTSFGEMVEKACRIALDQDIAKVGERLVITAGVPFGTPGTTNILRIAWVEEFC
ncbi:pyruvate kinase [Caenispirillum bisanense]|uniref:Pyruvate kinase n=1 Tax=Caenispirillum bisanense TaxID=414052 RepID=A0A286G7J7_9PROT|nr:pyruvate kinase [Caenispirillum bisanense]SOD91109.1 pyruvate kinase [Caenispirillum bisanense]